MKESIEPISSQKGSKKIPVTPETQEEKWKDEAEEVYDEWEKSMFGEEEEKEEDKPEVLSEKEKERAQKIFQETADKIAKIEAKGKNEKVDPSKEKKVEPNVELPSKDEEVEELPAEAIEEIDDKELSREEKAEIEKAEAVGAAIKPEGPKEKAEYLELEEELKDMPEEEREKIGFGLRNLGFWAEITKDRIFAVPLEKIAAKTDKRTTTGRFVSSLAENFRRDEKKARKMMEKREKTGKGKISNTGYILGNSVKYLRIAGDIAGRTISSPLRYFMLGSTMFGRGFEAAKDARLKNEKVIEKTRIKDIDKAAEEAWKIYKQAEMDKEKNKKVKKEDLEKAYLKNMPKDILERLAEEPEPGTATGVLQRIFQKDAEWSISRIEKKINKIEKKRKLTDEEKKIQKENILNKYKDHLKEFDAMVSQYGIVDGLAMSAKYGETASKGVMYAVMGETLTHAISNMGEKLAELFSSENIAEIKETIVEKAGEIKEEYAEQIEKSKEAAKEQAKAFEEKWIKPEGATETAPSGASAYMEGVEDIKEPEETKIPIKTETPEQEAATMETQIGEEAKAIEAKEAEATKTATEKAPIQPHSAEGYEAAKEDVLTEKAEIAETAETVERGVKADFTMELGKNGIPAQPERVFQMLALDHMDNVTDTSGNFTEEHASKSLNMAANLVRLSEGKDTIGLEADKIKEIFTLDQKTGVLEIKKHSEFNELLEKLEKHSDSLWEKGVLQKGALAHIDNIKPEAWEKMLHANEIEKAGNIETGITGHDDITTEKIPGFENSETVKAAESALEQKETVAKIAQGISGDIETTPSGAGAFMEGMEKHFEDIESEETEARETKEPQFEEESLNEGEEPPKPEPEKETTPTTPEKIATEGLIKEIGFTKEEYTAIENVTIGRLFVELKESLELPDNEIGNFWSEKGGGIDLKHEGDYDIKEFKKHLALAKKIRSILPDGQLDPDTAQLSIKNWALAHYAK